MKKHEVKVGGTFLAKVSDKVVPVRITGESRYGGWDAVNTKTGKVVRIKSAQRLRGPATLSKAEVQAAVGAQVGAGAKPAAGSAKDTKPALSKAEGVPPAAAGGETTNSLEAHYRGQKDAAKAEKAAKVAAWRKEVAAKGAKPDPELDKAIKAADAKGRQKKAKAKAERKPGCLDAAIRVLQEAGKPMGCQDIVKAALAKGYWQTKGATPAATLYAAVIREVAAKGKDARFRRAEVKETRDGKAVSLRGYFELTEAAKGR